MKSSLLGTSARQKLLKHRLEAYQAKVVAGDNQNDTTDLLAQISGQIADLNPPNMATSKQHHQPENEKAASKKTQKERMLEQIYRA